MIILGRGAGLDGQCRTVEGGSQQRGQRLGRQSCHRVCPHRSNKAFAQRAVAVAVVDRVLIDVIIKPIPPTGRFRRNIRRCRGGLNGGSRQRLSAEVVAGATAARPVPSHRSMTALLVPLPPWILARRVIK